MWAVKALAIFRGCAGSSEPSLLAYAIGTIILRTGLFHEIKYVNIKFIKMQNHICHKFQQGLYQVKWGSTQVDFMLESELCSRKEHTHRLIELPSVSHAAWTYCRTGKSFKGGGGGGGGGERVGVSVSYIFKP